MLRKALYANAIFTGMSALVALLFSGFLADEFEVAPLILVAVGAGLLGWTWLVWIFARRDPTRRREAWIVIAGDEAWVIGVIVLLAAYPDVMSDSGKLILAVLTIVVAALASFQLLGLRQMR